MKQKNVYLIAKYSAHPRKKHATAAAGYMKDPANVQWDEQVIVTLGLKNKDFLTGRIVLNINEQKVERNSFQNGKTFMELFEYFYNANPQDISRSLQQFGLQVGKKETQDDGLQENVPGQSEASEGSVVATATNVIGPSQSH